MPKKPDITALPLAIQRSIGGLMNNTMPGAGDARFDACFGRPDDPSGLPGTIVRDIPRWKSAPGPNNVNVLTGSGEVSVPSYEWDSESGDASSTDWTYNAQKTGQSEWTGITVTRYVRRDPARPAYVINSCRQDGGIYDVLVF